MKACHFLHTQRKLLILVAERTKYKQIGQALSLQKHDGKLTAAARAAFCAAPPATKAGL